MMYKTDRESFFSRFCPIIPIIAFQLRVPRTLASSVHGLNNLYYVKKTLALNGNRRLVPCLMFP